MADNITQNGQMTQAGWSDEEFLIRNNPPEFSRDGYDFICWNTKRDGSGTSYYPNTKNFFQVDTTLYAQWKLVYKYMDLVEVGDVDIQSNIAKKYNVNSGLRTPNYFVWNSTNAFELVLKLTTSSDVSTKQIIYRMQSDYVNNLCLYNGKLYVEKASAYSTVTFAGNTTYYIKISKNGTILTVYRSLDNVNYEQVLSTTVNVTSTNDYFAFGQNYSYTASRQESYVTDEEYTVTTYTKYAHWNTNESSCAYRNRNGKVYTYAEKLKHATFSNFGIYKIPEAGGKFANINKSNGCGYWSIINEPHYEKRTRTVTKTKTVSYVVAVANFLGQMDFNESYFILNGIKYKLRVKA